MNNDSNSRRNDQAQQRAQRCKTLSKLATRFVHEEIGATAIEYAILAAAIAAVIVTIVASLGTKVTGALTVPPF